MNLENKVNKASLKLENKVNKAKMNLKVNKASLNELGKQS